MSGAGGGPGGGVWRAPKGSEVPRGGGEAGSWAGPGRGGRAARSRRLQPRGRRVPVQAMASRERAAVPRQRGDKTRTPSAAPPDAVPGRLCEAQWLSVLAAEERDDAVGDVVAELLGAVAERCFRAELSRQVGGTAGPSAAAAWGAVGAEWASQRRRAAPCPQCAPFAVDWARAELLQAVAWRFLVRDEGDAAPEAAGAWREDEEPLPCADDAWAEGAVPVLPACPTPAHGEVMRPFPPTLGTGGFCSPCVWGQDGAVS